MVSPRPHLKEIEIATVLCRGEITDAVVMDGRGFGFITFLEPEKAQQFLEVRDLTTLPPI